MGKVMTDLDRIGQPILVEDSYLAARREEVPFMLQVGCFADLQADGKFDDADLLRRIETAQFKAIITRFPFDASVKDRSFSPRWIRAMRDTYELTSFHAIPHGGPTLYVYQPHAAVSQMRTRP
jgi:hypothetical protein